MYQDRTETTDATTGSEDGTYWMYDGTLKSLDVSFYEDESYQDPCCDRGEDSDNHDFICATR